MLSDNSINISDDIICSRHNVNKHDLNKHTFRSNTLNKAINKPNKSRNNSRHNSKINTLDNIFSDIISTNWNNKIETVVKNIGETCKIYKIMHITVAQKTTKIYNILMFLGIIFGPTSGILSGYTYISDKYDIIGIIGSIIAFISGIIVSIIKFSNYTEEIILNKEASSKYSLLESNIRRQLSLYRNDRIEPMQYMEWLENKFDEIFNTYPLIPIDLYNKYIEQHDSLILPYQLEIDVNSKSIDEKSLDSKGKETKVELTKIDSNNLEEKSDKSENSENVKSDSKSIKEMKKELSEKELNKKLNNLNNLTDTPYILEIKKHETKQNREIKKDFDPYSDGMMKYQINRMLSRV